MAITNRDLNATQQKEVLHWRGHTQINTGYTSWIGVVPFPCVVESARVVAVGVSAAMQVAFQAQRFAGGNTVIALGISNLILASYGTSGMQGYSGLAAPGATVLALQLGDILMFETSVANSAALQVALEVVLRKTQDIVSHNGVST